MAISTVTTSSVVIVVIALVVPWTSTSVDAASRENICACYHTSADDYFSHYKFYDFRSISVPSGVPELQSFLPVSANDRSGQSEDDVGKLQSGFISSAAWGDIWRIQSWGKGKKKDTQYRMWNSYSNVYIDKNNDGDATATTKLVLRTKRFEEFQSTAEVEYTLNNILYASVRIRARVLGDPGAVAGMFYYRDGTNESDLEVLTRDEHSAIRYSNHPIIDEGGNQIKDSSTKMDLNTRVKFDKTGLKEKFTYDEQGTPNMKWTDWHTHRIDWVEGRSSWYVDGQHYLDKTYGVPTSPSRFILNMWSDGGEWSGVMSENGEAKLEIEWIEMVYNTTSPLNDGASEFADCSAKFHKPEYSNTSDKDDDTCEAVCQVDADDCIGVAPGGFIPRSAQSYFPQKGTTRGSGTDNREFVIATFLGAMTAVVLYIIDYLV